MGGFAVNLIGDIRLYAHGREVQIRGTRQLALLARLALSPGEEVAREVLVHDVWNGEQPRSGTGALRILVKRLRDSIGDDSSCLITSPRGYLLDRNVRVDLLDLEAALENATALAESSPEGAVALLDTVRPPLSARPLHRLADHDFATPVRQRILRRQREAALLTGRISLALGNPGPSLGLLADLSKLDPFDEAVALALTDAQHAAGNTREALRTMAGFRLALRDVGLSPSAAFHEREDRLLNPDRSGPAGRSPGGSMGSRTPGRSTVDSAPETDRGAAGNTELRGRRSEVEAVTEALADVARGRGGCLMVRGEAGIGKSALLAHGADHAIAHGLPVWWSKADEVASARPYDLLLRLRRISADMGATDIGRSGHLLEVPDGSPTGGLVDDFVAAVQDAVSAGPMVIVLDDLHWADAESAEVLPLLIRDLSDHAVLFLSGMRPWPHRPHVADMTRQLAALGVTTVELGPLDIAAVVDLVEAEFGGRPDPAAVAALEAAGGNAFLAKVIIEQSAPSRGGSTSSASTQRMFEALPTTTIDFLQLAATFGSRFRVGAVADLAGEDAEALWAAAEPALEARLVIRTGDDFAFRHDLIRETLYTAVPPAIRAKRHHDASAILLRSGADPGEVLRHATLAVDGGMTEAVPTLVETAEQLRFESPRVAADALRQVRESRALEPAQREHIDEALAECCLFSGRLIEAEAVARNGIAGSVDEPRLTRLRFILAAVLFLRGQLREAAERFTEVYRSGDEAGTDLGVAGVDAALAYLTASDLSQAKRLCDEILADSHSTLANVYANGVRGMLSALDGELDDGLRFAERGVAMADAHAGADADRNTPHYFLAQVEVWADRHDSARQTIATGRKRSADLGLGWHEPMFHVALAESHLRCADLDAAAASAEAGLRYAADHHAHIEDARLHSIIAECALLRDDRDLAVEHLEACDRSQRASGGHGADRLFAVQSRLARMDGDHDAALATLELLWGGLDMLGARLPQWDVAPGLAFLLMATNRRSSLDSIIAEMTTWPSQPRPWILRWCRHLRDRDVDGLDALCHARGESDGGGLDRLHLRSDIIALGGSVTDGVAVADIGSATHGPELTWWGARLTASERRVVERLAQGRTNAQIADELFVSRRTVESHLHRVYPKLSVANRVELAVLVNTDSQKLQ